MAWKRLTSSGGANWTSGNSWDTGTFTPMQYLHLEALYSIATGATDPVITFNDDDGSGTTYNYVRCIDGINVETQGTNALIENDVGGGGDGVLIYDCVDIFNPISATADKIAVVHTCYSETGDMVDGTPHRREYTAKSRNVDRIEKINFITLTGNFDYGTASLWGSDEVETVVPNIPNGSVFITSDTNVHYMWNSSAETWNEVA